MRLRDTELVELSSVGTLFVSRGVRTSANRPTMMRILYHGVTLNTGHHFPSSRLATTDKIMFHQPSGTPPGTPPGTACSRIACPTDSHQSTSAFVSSSVNGRSITHFKLLALPAGSNSPFRAARHRLSDHHDALVLVERVASD